MSCIRGFVAGVPHPIGHGPLFSWYAGDMQTLWQMGNYYDDRPHGRQIQWAPNGDLKTIEHYKHGVLRGERLGFKNDRLAFRQLYNDLERVGVEYRWNEDGSLQSVIVHSQAGSKTVPGDVVTKFLSQWRPED